jgi:hypothetical protein
MASPFLWGARSPQLSSLGPSTGRSNKRNPHYAPPSSRLAVVTMKTVLPKKALLDQKLRLGGNELPVRELAAGVKRGQALEVNGEGRG